MTPKYYIEAWLAYFEPHIQREQAVQMSAYLKGQFEFLGLKAPERRVLGKNFIQQEGLPALEILPAVIRLFWDCPYREAHYFAMELPMKYKKQWTTDILPLFEEMIVTNSWWDTVDNIASNLAGIYFQKFPEAIPVVIPKWVESPNLWLNRSAIIFQLKYKEQTDWELLKQSILPHIASKEFFHRKAIGWALRQYGRFAPEQVIDFVKSQPLSNLSKREAMKHLG